MATKKFPYESAREKFERILRQARIELELSMCGVTSLRTPVEAPQDSPNRRGQVHIIHYANGDSERSSIDPIEDSHGFLIREKERLYCPEQKRTEKPFGYWKDKILEKQNFFKDIPKSDYFPEPSPKAPFHFKDIPKHPYEIRFKNILRKRDLRTDIELDVESGPAICKYRGVNNEPCRDCKLGQALDYSHCPFYRLYFAPLFPTRR